ncbi:Hypothetical predicted protein [Xyrichtys novacula]|uniref:Uncharacterized protein n=1 Tax=Xyrichtys novacula TaxID=13765 RepID=A0AAV1HPX6_XYRNO|nr:Hypothetical predicted protein [Xyrichtys novacula]
MHVAATKSHCARTTTLTVRLNSRWEGSEGPRTDLIVTRAAFTHRGISAAQQPTSPEAAALPSPRALFTDIKKKKAGVTAVPSRSEQTLHPSVCLFQPSVKAAL